jgi:ABC-type sugar transport system substrate-binding protein
MRPVRLLVCLAAALVLVTVAGCASPPDRTSAGDATAATRKSGFTFAVSAYSLTNTFAVALLQGVKQRAERNGDTVTLTTDGQFEGEKQGHDMQDIVTSSPDAVLLAAGDTAQSRTWVDQAADAQVPVFGLYNAIDHYGPPLYKGVIAGVQVDEKASGAAAAEIAAKIVSPGSTVGVILGKAGYAEVTDRQLGFRDALATTGLYTVLTSENGDWSPQHGQEACQQMIAAHPDVRFIYNESDDLVTGCAKASNLGSVKLVGNAGSKASLALVRSGVLSGTTCYGPVQIGERVAQQAHDFLSKAPGSTAGLVLVAPTPITRDNLSDCPEEW